MVSQIYSYIALLEAGIGTTTLQALYGPVVEGDKNNISAIINATQKYYNKIVIVYSATVIAVSFLLPVILKSSLEPWQMILYFFLFGISNIVNFAFTAAMRPLLLAEGKNYINNNITLCFHIGSQFLKVVLLNIGLNIVLLQGAYSLINILQIAVYFIYFRKNYRWVDKKIPPQNEALKQKNAFLFQQISNLVFSCTDVVLLSIFCDLNTASIYSVYMLIFNALSILISMLTNSTQFILGQTYNKDEEKYKLVHRVYEILIVLLAFILYTTAYILCIPFIKIYTAGVSDINYVQSWLPLLFCLNGMLSTCKTTALQLINFSFHAQKTLIRTIVEAVINLFLSLIFVQFWGIYGVLIGTTIALVYRVIDATHYVHKYILHIKAHNAIKTYIYNFLLFIVIILVMLKHQPILDNYIDFILNCLFYTGALSGAYLAVNILCNLDLIKKIKTIRLRNGK